MDDGFDFSEPYDKGWRKGTFDKCNGQPRATWEDCADDTWNEIFIDGYNEAYDSNEVRING